MKILNTSLYSSFLIIHYSLFTIHFSPLPQAQAVFPAQQRAPGDPALIARGKTLFQINCVSCHGVDLRGGDQGGPNLLRSQVVLSDKSGELIQPIVRGARPAQGTDPINISDD